MTLRLFSPLRFSRGGIPAAVTVLTLLTVSLAVTARPAQAQEYNVSLDTSQLTPGDQYAVDLQLIQGFPTPTGAPNSLVNVSGFIFGGGGSPGTIDFGGGGAGDGSGSTGSLSSQVTLDNSQSTNADFTQEFSGGGAPNNFVSFNVDASKLYANPGWTTQDQFSFDLVDNTAGPQVPTNAPGGANTLFTLTNDPTNGFTPTAYGYTGVDGNTYMTQYSTVQPAATPELGTGISLGVLLGLFGLGALRARRGEQTPDAPLRK